MGEDAAELLRAVMEPSRSELVDWRRHQVMYVPSRRLTVAFATTLRTPRGETVERLLVLRTGHRPAPDTAILGQGDVRVEAWVVPDDPQLPGMAAAMSGDSSHRLASQIGLGDGPVTSRIHSYRPGRRAVVEWCVGEDRVFVKCLRPRRVRELQDLHRTLGDPTTVARSLGWSADLGLVVIEAVPGITLERSLSCHRAVPDARSLIEILDRLPNLSRGSQQPDDDFDRHRRLLEALLPDQSDNLARLSDRLRSSVDDPLVTVHGDFHPAQVLVEDGRIRGLIDIDRARPGHRVDDLATMLAHLNTVSLSGPSMGRHASYGQALLDQFDRLTEPSTLRRRIAAALLGYAAGGFTTQAVDWRDQAMLRIEAATQWADAADRVA